MSHTSYALEWPESLKPLRHIAYQRNLNALVCISCGILVLQENIFGHLKDQHHLSVSSQKKTSIEQSLNELGIKKGVIPPLPGGHIPPFPWLKPPVIGKYCRFCKVVSSPSEKVIRKHIQLSACGKKFAVDRDPKPFGTTFMQRFTSHSVGKSWFRVYPALQNTDPQGRFARFFDDLSPEAKEGGAIYKSLLTPNQSYLDRLDVSPFLSQVNWLGSTQSYSLFKMRKTVAIPSREDPYFPIKGLGRQLLSSISSLQGIQPRILSGLMAWRNSW